MFEFRNWTIRIGFFLLLTAIGGLCRGAEIRTLLLEPVDAKRNRIVPLKVYLPQAEKALPVVLFSHGLGGSRNNNAYLGNHWAENGYVAVFMQHPGSDESVWKSVDRTKRRAALNRAASLRSTLDRYRDVPFVIDQLEGWSQAKDHSLGGRLDLDHIGLSGHSFGAVTTLGLMGRKFRAPQTFGDSRIAAFLPMSPKPGRSPSPEERVGHIKAPVLCMTGTKDGSPLDSSLNPESRQLVYAALPKGDKYQLVFEGGEHHAFGDGGGKARQRNPNHHPAIQQISVKFWDAYLKGDVKAKEWLQSKAPRRDCKLHSKDVWEWK